MFNVSELRNYVRTDLGIEFHMCRAEYLNDFFSWLDLGLGRKKSSFLLVL